MGHLSVAVEVSALSHGSHEQRSFVAFALTALRADESTDAATWSSRWLRRRDRIGAERSTRSWLVARSSVLGIAPKVTWAAPHAQVVLLASGPLVFRVDLPGVITIHSVTDVMRFEDAGSPSHRVGELLRRSVGAGALIHTVCSAAADAAVSILKLDRASVAVAFPGLDVTPRTALASSESVGVVAGMNQALDLATVDAVRLRGVPAELIQAADAASSRPCVVFASPGNGFPFAAIEAMACDSGRRRAHTDDERDPRRRRGPRRCGPDNRCGRRGSRTRDQGRTSHSCRCRRSSARERLLIGRTRTGAGLAPSPCPRITMTINFCSDC